MSHATEAMADDIEGALERLAVLIESSPHKLVSPRALAELRDRHLAECRAFAELLPRGRARVLDLGSGGGLPGLVVAIIRPELEMHLVEATRKKASFLEDASSDLGLAVQVHWSRAEDLSRGELARSFDIVTARAVAPLARLAELSEPFLVPNGLLYAIKGERWERELDEAHETLHARRLHVVATPADQLSQSPREPSVVVLSRAADPG